MTLFLLATLMLPPWKAVGQSFLFPGWTEWQMGYKTEARLFWAMEGTFVLSWLWSTHEATRLEQNARAYAVDHAVTHTGEGACFWSLVERYIRTEDYIRALWIEARNLYPNNRNKQEAYVAAHQTSGSWAWEDTTAWFHYSDLRAASRNWENRGRVLLGSILALHITSAINAFLKNRLQSRIRVVGQLTPEEARLGFRLLR